MIKIKFTKFTNIWNTLDSFLIIDVIFLFSRGNTGYDLNSSLSFQVASSNTVTEWLLPPNFTAWIHSTGWKERGPSLFLPTTSTHWQAFRHLFAALHVRWLPHIFNHNILITSHYIAIIIIIITIWLIDDDDGMLISIYLII